MKILLVINPKSGGEEKDGFINRFKQLCLKKLHQLEIFTTSGNNDVQKAEEIINAFRPDRIISAGGDGTIRLACETLLKNDWDIPIGIIPKGSANGLATCLGLPNDEQLNILTAIESQHLRKIDVQKINNEHLCIHLFDVGINALMVKKYEEANSRGLLGYGKYLLDAIKESPIVQFKINSKEISYEAEGYMLIGANGNKYGTGVIISDGDLDDGRFDLRVISEINMEEMVKSSLTIFNIFVENDMFSDSTHHREATISINKKTPLQIDGEYIGETNQIHVRTIPLAIKIIVPYEK